VIQYFDMFVEGGGWQPAAYETVGSATAWCCISTRNIVTRTSWLWQDTASKCNSWCMCFKLFP